MNPVQNLQNEDFWERNTARSQQHLVGVTSIADLQPLKMSHVFRCRFRRNTYGVSQMRGS